MNVAKIRRGDTLVDVYAKTELLVTEDSLPAGRIRVLPTGSDTEKVLSLEDIAQKISADEYVLHRKSRPRVSPALQNDPQLDLATAQGMHVLAKINAHRAKYGVSVCEAYSHVRKQHQTSGDSQQFPSRATVYRYLKSERSGAPLLCGNKNKGNRIPRYGEEVCSLVVRLAREQFLVPQSRVNVHSLTKIVNRQARDMGIHSARSDISRKFVEKVVFQRLSADPEYERTDPKVRSAAKAVAKHQIRVFNVLERVEQDALHLPFLVETPSGPSRNVWLVHAVCCATSMPVGWCLVVGSPSASDGLRCAESVFFSKKEKFEKLGIATGVDVFGLPSNLVFDNGPEAKNERMMALTRLGTSPQYCKSRHPQHKPFIERLNRSLKEALQTLPGCTRFDGVDGTRDPELLGDPSMSLEELERWIVRWYYEVWANTVLQRLVHTSEFCDADLGATPKQRFMRMQEQGYAMPLPPNRRDWLLTTYIHDERTLCRKTGITVEGFHFKGDNLTLLIDRFGATRVKVLYDPDDYRTVYVLDGEQLVPLHNCMVNEYTPAHSFNAAKERAAIIASAPDAEGTAQRAAFERDLYQRSTEASGKSVRSKPSPKSTSHQTTAESKQKAAVARAMANPLPASFAPGNPDADISLGSVEGLVVVNRSTGGSL